MTCIVGIETEDGVIMGADSMAADGSWFAHVRTDAPKVFALREYLFGFTTSFRMGDLLRYHLTLPPPPKSRVHRHMVTAVIPAIRECLKSGGFATTANGAEAGGDFLMATRGRLYHVASDYQVGRSAHGYDAAGCGSSIALGALAATGGQEPRKRLRSALVAAERHSAGVRRPWRFITEKP